VSTSQPVKAPPVEPERLDVSPDLLLDGLSYLGEGTWHAFQNIAAATSKDPWAATTLARDLRDLGHLDFRCDKAGRPSHWRVAGPALVFTAGDECYLSGFRSAGLVDEIGDGLESLNAEYSRGEGDFSRIAWKGVTVEAAREALRGVLDPHGRSLAVVSNPALAIAAAAWTASQIYAACPPIHVESLSDLDVFSPADGRWKRATSLKEAGAYRSHFAGRRYFFRDEEGETRATPAGLAKVLAARRAGMALHSYDATRRLLSGQLGCELPGLLGRSATSCSGRLPVEERGQYSYRDVPADVARMIIAKVYG
jgi:hypothetical protein